VWPEWSASWTTRGDGDVGAAWAVRNTEETQQKRRKQQKSGRDKRSGLPVEGPTRARREGRQYTSNSHKLGENTGTSMKTSKSIGDCTL